MFSSTPEIESCQLRTLRDLGDFYSRETVGPKLSYHMRLCGGGSVRPAFVQIKVAEYLYMHDSDSEDGSAVRVQKSGSAVFRGKTKPAPVGAGAKRS